MRLIFLLFQYIKEFKSFFKGYKYPVKNKKHLYPEDEHNWESLKYWCVIFSGNRKRKSPQDMSTSQEYLVTFNQNTFYIFCLLRKVSFLVPDFNSCFPNDKFLFTSLKMALEGHTTLYIHLNLALCMGKILDQNYNNSFSNFSKSRNSKYRTFYRRKAKISLKGTSNFPEVENHT